MALVLAFPQPAPTPTVPDQTPKPTTTYNNTQYDIVNALNTCIQSQLYKRDCETTLSRKASAVAWLP
eukprot:6416582-Amphidinium_carterae.1